MSIERHLRTIQSDLSIAQNALFTMDKTTKSFLCPSMVDNLLSLIFKEIGIMYHHFYKFKIALFNNIISFYLLSWL